MKAKARSLIRTSRRLGLLLFVAMLLATGALTWRASSDRAPPSEADRQIEEAVTAFRLLKEHYVEPPDPSSLLTAGWTGARDAVSRRIPEILEEPTPRYAGNVARDEARFRKGLKELLNQSRGEVTPEELAQAAIAAMAKSLGDNHTVFVPPAVWQRVRAGQTLGPGYNVVPVAAGSLVWEVLPGSGAERAGLQPGDVIVAPQDLFDLSQDFALDPNDPMSLTVKRDGATINLQLAAEPSEFEFFDLDVIDRNVAYIRIRSFLSNKDDAFRNVGFMDAILTSLQFGSRSPDAWVIDLRNNAGGSSGVAAYLARRLGLTSPLAEIVNRDGTSSLISDDAESLTGDSPVVILVNQYTLSAAELFAAAFQDAGHAYIVGEKTRGAVKASDRFEVAGGALSITTGRVYAGPNRRYLDKVGVTPDRLVALDSESVRQARVLGVLRGQKKDLPNRDGYDSQVQAALDYLRPLLQR